MDASPSGSTYRRRPHVGRLAVALGSVLLVSACSTMTDIPAGTSLADVQARYGRPTVECPMPDGSRHLVWSSQPMGQYAWGTVVGPDGKVSRVDQVLTDAAFGQVKLGSWTAEQLRCAFGPPAQSARVGLPGSTQLVWSYRYKQSGAWNSLMHFYLSEDGVVTRMHPGPDPLFDPPEWMVL